MIRATAGKQNNSVTTYPPTSSGRAVRQKLRIRVGLRRAEGNRRSGKSILEAKSLNGSPALRLAAEGWLDILNDGNGGDVLPFSGNESVLWIEVDGKPVAILLYQLQEYRNEFWISLSYVNPAHRGCGLFRRLYSRLVRIARARTVTRIAGGINCNNPAMRAVAERCGRSADYIVYAQSLSEK